MPSKYDDDTDKGPVWTTSTFVEEDRFTAKAIAKNDGEFKAWYEYVNDAWQKTPIEETALLLQVVTKDAQYGALFGHKTFDIHVEVCTLGKDLGTQNTMTGRINICGITFTDKADDSLATV